MLDLRFIKAIVVVVVTLYLYWRQFPDIMERLAKLSIADPFRELPPLTPLGWRRYLRFIRLLREQEDRGSRAEAVLCLAVIYIYLFLPNQITVSW